MAATDDGRAVGSSCTSGDGSGLRAELLWTETSCESFDYVVQARVYGGVVVATSRGSGANPRPALVLLRAREGGGGGDASGHPEILARHAFDEAVEGQDVILSSGHMVVASKGSGMLYTFNFTEIMQQVQEADRNALPIAISPVSSLQLPVSSVLHVRLAEDYSDGEQRVAAILSAGFAAGGMDDAVIAADVTRLDRPVHVSTIHSGVNRTEEIMINQTTDAAGRLLRREVIVGGFGSDRVALVDAADLRELRVVQHIRRNYYKQMVGEILNTYSPAGVRHDFFVSALWGDPGGVAVFDATLPTNASRSLELKELAHTATAELSRANRVVLLNASTTSTCDPHVTTSENGVTCTSRMAMIPLEQDPHGGIGFVDVSMRVDGGGTAAASARPVGRIVFAQEDSRVYCAAAVPGHEDSNWTHVWSWSAQTCTFNAMRIRFERPRLDASPPSSPSSAEPCTVILENARSRTAALPMAAITVAVLCVAAALVSAVLGLRKLMLHRCRRRRRSLGPSSLTPLMTDGIQ